MRLASLRIYSALLAHLLHRCDGIFLRLSKDRYSLTNLLTGLPVVVLTTTGAKSGKPRRTPLAAVFDNEKVILIASSFGKDKNPGWYYNLKKYPHARISGSGKAGAYTSSEAQGEEREKYWQQALQLYAGYTRYQQRAGKRKIPIMVLEPIKKS